MASPPCFIIEQGTARSTLASDESAALISLQYHPESLDLGNLTSRHKAKMAAGNPAAIYVKVVLDLGER
jgi:hypothetical protein